MKDFLIVMAVLFALGWLFSRVSVNRKPKGPSKGQIIAGAGAVLIGVAAVALMVANEIKRWFTIHRRPNSLGELVREAVNSGNVNYEANIFDLLSQRVVDNKRWENTAPSQEIDNRFGNSNRIKWYEA